MRLGLGLGLRLCLLRLPWQGRRRHDYVGARPAPCQRSSPSTPEAPGPAAAALAGVSGGRFDGRCPPDATHDRMRVHNREFDAAGGDLVWAAAAATVLLSSHCGPRAALPTPQDQHRCQDAAATRADEASCKTRHEWDGNAPGGRA